MKITKKITNEIIFEDNSNTIKDSVINAVAKGAYLRGADLGGAYLRGANLGGADLRGANLGDAYLGDAYLGGANLGDANLGGADLGGAYLRGADLGGANLGDAYLGDADLGDADLGGADLRGADLRGANLGGAYLRYADLRGADLGGANLRGADLRGAYLRGADLGGANLGDANLDGANNIPFIPLFCPSDGEFIGWKKVNDKLVQLLITSDARRSSSTSNKCRCDKAKVLEITDLDGNNPISSITNYNYAETSYVVGEMVYPDSFDENRWNECSHGIHFFINKQEAINY